jgi:hypothetical protein
MVFFLLFARVVANQRLRACLFVLFVCVIVGTRGREKRITGVANGVGPVFFWQGSDASLDCPLPPSLYLIHPQFYC